MRTSELLNKNENYIVINTSVSLYIKLYIDILQTTHIYV